MVDPSRNENEGYKAHSEGNSKIGLESALPKSWGLSRIFNGWKMLLFVIDTDNGLIVMGDLPKREM